MTNTSNTKLPKKLWIPSLVLSILSVIPMYFVYVYIMDMTKLGSFNTISATEVDEIMSRNIHELRFLLPCIALVSLMVIQGVFSALILKNYKGWQNKGFAISNLFFGGLAISNIFLLLKFIKSQGTANAIKISSVGIGTVSTLAIPLSIFSISMGAGSIDDPTHLANIEMSDQAGQENVVEIFTDGFDPTNALPFFQKDELFGDFVSLDRMVTGGYTTEPSYSEMMGGVDRGPYFLQRELDNKDNKKAPHTATEGLDTSSYDAYLHENFMDSLITHMKRDSFEKSYIGNPDDDGYFKTYFQHVSGDPDKLVKRNDFLSNKLGETKTHLDVFNWGQAKDETATAGVNSYQNNVAVYKWMEENIKVTHDKNGHGTRIFMQDSITHAPRVIGNDGSLSFTAVADSAKLNEGVAFAALHKVLSDLVESLKANKVYDNTLISIYGDHSDHSNTIDKPSDKNPIYMKNWGQAIVKYPHTKHIDGSHMISNRTPFYGPNMSGLISDYFNNPSTYDGKTALEQSKVLSEALNIQISKNAHISNYNHFISLKSNDKHDGAFVTWDNPDKDDAKLVPYIPDAIKGVSDRAVKDDVHGNWVNYDDFLKFPGIETEILGMGWR